MKEYKYLAVFYLFTTLLYSDEIDFTHDGWDRECYLYKPSCIPDDVSDDFEPVPLVLMFHGLGGEGVDNYGFNLVSEDSCFVVAFPSGLYNTWNCGPDTPYGHDIDDNSYVDALIDTIYNNYPIDTNRIYGTGHSMGGGFTNHLACTSTRFTALGSSGGWMNPNYIEGYEYDYLCDPLSNGYTVPIIHSHGIIDETVPVQWGQLAAAYTAGIHRCNNLLEVFYSQIGDWQGLSAGSDFEEYDYLIEELLTTADTIEFTGEINRYQWSYGCNSEPSVDLLLLPNQQHAWHQTWNSPISTPIEHWNFMSQFSKDEMGPALDSLVLGNGEVVTLDNEYYIDGDATPVSLLAVDNYSVAAMTISFSGFINIEGFDLTISFNTDHSLLNLDTAVVLGPEISTDNYETVQISLVDHDGNEKVYELEELQDLGLYQQMAIMNNITTSTDDGSLSPESYTLHQNYPNPFNPVTTISYDIPEDALVNVTIYNMGGEVVKTLINQVQTSGYKSIQWNATNTVGQAVSAGLYLYRIHAGDFIMSKKMVLLK
jgi:poly(3-hydroxybutyrate) depolymerase